MTRSEASAERALRIAMMIETDGPGGAEVCLLELSEELRRRGHQVLAVGPKRERPGFLSTQLRERGFERRTFELSRPLDPACLRGMVQMLADEGVDVVHSHEFTMSVYGSVAARRLGLPHVLTLHGSETVADAARRRMALRLAFRLSDAAVAVSAHTRRVLEQRIGPGSRGLQIVHNGIAPKSGDAAAARRDLGLAGDDLLLLAVGNLHHHKGHDVLIDALADLGTTVQAWNLVIAGRGPAQEDLEARIRERGLEDRIRLLGVRNDVADLQAAADIFCMPSRGEGLPLAVLEAMFASNAIVASEVGGIPEAVTHERHGLLVPPDNVELLSGALARLLGDPELRARLGAAARERADKDFHVRAMADGYEQHYRQALARR